MVWSNLNHIYLPHFTFANLCRGHAAVDLLLGAAILYSVDLTATTMHGSAAAKELFGDEKDAVKSDDKVALRVSESLVGLLLVDMGILLSVISTSSSKEFQKLTCKCALGIHGLMITWRLMYQHHVISVRKDIGSQLLSDVLFASSWGLFLYKLFKSDKMQKF